MGSHSPRSALSTPKEQEVMDWVEGLIVRLKGFSLEFGVGVQGLVSVSFTLGFA